MSCDNMEREKGNGECLKGTNWWGRRGKECRLWGNTWQNTERPLLNTLVHFLIHDVSRFAPAPLSSIHLVLPLLQCLSLNWFLHFPASNFVSSHFVILSFTRWPFTFSAVSPSSLTLVSLHSLTHFPKVIWETTAFPIPNVTCSLNVNIGKE